MYLIKYPEFLLWLTLHMLSLGLKVCAGRLFHCCQKQEEDRKSPNQPPTLKKKSGCTSSFFFTKLQKMLNAAFELDTEDSNVPVLTKTLDGLTHEGGSVVAGSRLHGPGTIRVASGQRFGDRRAGLSTRITCPSQNELQRRSLRKRLKRRQPLREKEIPSSPVTQGRILDTGQTEIHANPPPFRLEWFPTWLVSC